MNTTNWWYVSETEQARNESAGKAEEAEENKLEMVYDRNGDEIGKGLKKIMLSYSRFSVLASLPKIVRE